MAWNLQGLAKKGGGEATTKTSRALLAGVLAGVVGNLFRSVQRELQTEIAQAGRKTADSSFSTAAHKPCLQIRTNSILAHSTLLAGHLGW
jgi:hypothetical protein